MYAVVKHSQKTKCDATLSIKLVKRLKSTAHSKRMQLQKKNSISMQRMLLRSNEYLT